MNYDLEMNYNTGSSYGVGEKKGLKKLLKSIFSVKKIYKRNVNGRLLSVYKQFCILGFKFNKRIKYTKYEKYLLEMSCVIASILNDSGYIKPKAEIQEVFESDKPEDKLMVENLYKNLDNEAKNNLDRIFKRNKRVIKFCENIHRYPKAHEIYTIDELDDYKKKTRFEKEIEVYDDYFKWKNFILPVNYFEPSVFLHKHGIDFIKNKEAVNGSIIDVGANIGDSALIFRENFPENQIISFEPVDKTYQLCQKTLKLNKTENAVVEKLGLGDMEAVSFIENIGEVGTASKISDSGTEEIKMTTLDKYVQKNKIKVGLIKTDVEGFESNFLRGAQETIRTQAPVLLLSIYHNCSDFYKLKPMVEEIMKTSRFKYRYDFFQPVYNATITECLLICERIW